MPKKRRASFRIFIDSPELGPITFDVGRAQVIVAPLEGVAKGKYSNESIRVLCIDRGDRKLEARACKFDRRLRMEFSNAVFVETKPE